jgi:DNA-binding response OmpR family regulator
MLLGAGMFGKILCIEQDEYVRESRCAILKYSGFAASAASPRFAEILLRGREYDLIVLSGLSDFDLQRIINSSDGAKVLVLEEFTTPSEFLSLVAQRLDLARQLKV